MRGPLESPEGATPASRFPAADGLKIPAHKLRCGFSTAQHMSPRVLWLGAMLNLSLHAIAAIQSETSETSQRTDICVHVRGPRSPAHKRRRGFNTAQHMSQTVLWLEAMLEISLHSARGANRCEIFKIFSGRDGHLRRACRRRISRAQTPPRLQHSSTHVSDCLVARGDAGNLPAQRERRESL